MGTYRMFTDANGVTELQALNLTDNADLKAGIAAKRIYFVQWPPGTVVDWHPEPHRWFDIILEGQLEVDMSDGISRTFGPGDCRLVEDLTGKGHRTKVVGDTPVSFAVTLLENQAPGAPLTAPDTALPGPQAT